MRIFILLSVIAAAFASQQCGENEHFESCGTACPLTCGNYQNPPKVCVLRCDVGCHCDEGFVRSADGRCVRPSQCPQRQQECGANEHFEECGTACPLTCDNHDNPPKVCVLSCNVGCQCDEGFVRSTVDGRCVRPAQCPQRQQECGANEHFESCGTACPLTCDNYDNPPKACVLRCDIGCHCDKGFVRSTVDGRCVKPAQCPQREQAVCGENQRYTECGSACPLTCDNYARPPLICPAMCFIGCECQPGYVKTRDGKCIRPEQCPTSARTILKTCDEEADPGMCRGYVPSFYFDAKTGKCQKFIYGGCQGNGNRYATEEECMGHCGGQQQRSSDACDLPAETGVCRGAFPRFYFDRTTGRCQRFTYGGCGGNENNFLSTEECEATCARSAPSACQEEKAVGPCKARFIRYYFNKETGQCEEFVYGGCLGNSNNFNSHEGCMAVCSA